MNTKAALSATAYTGPLNFYAKPYHSKAELATAYNTPRRVPCHPHASSRPMPPTRLVASHATQVLGHHHVDVSVFIV